MTLEELARTYNNFAINHIPPEMLTELQNSNPEICCWKLGQPSISMIGNDYCCRFWNGYFFSFYHGEYAVGDTFGTQFVLEFKDLDFAIPNIQISVEELI